MHHRATRHARFIGDHCCRGVGVAMLDKAAHRRLKNGLSCQRTFLRLPTIANVPRSTAAGFGTGSPANGRLARCATRFPCCHADPREMCVACRSDWVALATSPVRRSWQTIRLAFFIGCILD